MKENLNNELTQRCHPEAHIHSRHPEARSAVRVLGQVSLRHVECNETSQDTTTEFVSQGPHGGKAFSGRLESVESGRSMVEMLGTLAIMGVLSIGGVAGYRYAVDKANANTIIDEVNKRSMIVSQQRILEQQINLTEFEASIKGVYPTYAEPYEDTRFFAVLVENVPQGVCRHILKEKLKTASDVFVSTGAGTGVDECPEGESTIEFAFGNILGEEGGGPMCPAGSTNNSSLPGYTGGSFNMTADGKTTVCYCQTEHIACGETCCDKGYECDGTTCALKCTGDNKPCNNGNIQGDYYCTRWPSGICRPVSSLTSKIVEAPEGFVAVQDHMSYYAASNWCLAQGMALIDTNTLNCPDSIGKTNGTAGKCMTDDILNFFYERHPSYYTNKITFWTQTPTKDGGEYRFYIEPSMPTYNSSNILVGTNLWNYIGGPLCKK